MLYVKELLIVQFQCRTIYTRGAIVGLLLPLVKIVLLCIVMHKMM